MSGIHVIDETRLRKAVPLDLAAVDCIDAAFRALTDEGVVMPPVLSMHLPRANGEVDIKTAYLPGFSGFAVKVSPGFFDNPARGLPSTSGLMILFSAETGQVQAVFLDNGYLTDVRTAAAGAVAARALSRKDAKHVVILGAGTQARMQLQALTLVRPVERAVIWARNAEKAAQAARDCAENLGIVVESTTDCEGTITGADIIVTTTPSADPLVMADWLRPGQHVTAMGSDQPGKSELDPACFKRADLYVPDRLSQTRKMGELRAAIDAGFVVQDRDFAELGDILCGSAPGRGSPDDITIADLTGTGAQDTAIATHALAAISTRGNAR
ncbi:cyclodeaminase [Algicella marina]|uniref:Cyclodeaminase n=1 Tax=Algicella marina TaxID=2683284 RepID=A0A6P1SZF3_9RHOB|nr:cyclodeaminase [Algicella marina]QHQ34409.1 cyclodeaminase [Algicella marina]